jgi:hypothetical protein
MQDNVPRMVFLLYEYKGEPANPTCRPDSVFPVTKHYARSLNCPPSSHRLPFLPLCRPLTAIHRRVLVHVSLSLFFAELGGLNIIISIVVPIGMKWDHWLDHWPALRLHHVLYQLWLQYYNSLFDLWYSICSRVFSRKNAEGGLFLVYWGIVGAAIGVKVVGRVVRREINRSRSLALFPTSVFALVTPRTVSLPAPFRTSISHL